MKRGFTILELLVASMLLAMLVTMLTMMFNQSSIAWRTGIASVSDLGEARRTVGAYHSVQDDILPGFGGNNNVDYRTVSLWEKGQLRTGQGAVRKVTSTELEGVGTLTMDQVRKGTMGNISNSGTAKSRSAVVVGFRSLGPDGQEDTEDDVTTWPEEVD